MVEINPSYIVFFLLSIILTLVGVLWGVVRKNYSEKFSEIEIRLKILEGKMDYSRDLLNKIKEKLNFINGGKGKKR